ncbi:MAG TPA: ISKra4 family transposase, partial [Ktedonobacteraceae bacterium]
MHQLQHQLSTPAAKAIISVDGAMVPLLKGKWAEVKTVVVGEIEVGKPGETAHSYHLSYFSRMQEATTFTEQASAELLRRGVDRAKQVCAVMDGAEWIDGFVDGQRPDALRILDFAHAAEYVSEIGQLAQGASIPLTGNWLQTQLHTLK